MTRGAIADDGRLNRIAKTIARPLRTLVIGTDEGDAPAVAM